jgi:hypothetical protein
MVYMQTFMPSVNVSVRVLERRCGVQEVRALLPLRLSGSLQKQPNEKRGDKERYPHPNKNPADKDNGHPSMLLPGR